MTIITNLSRNSELSYLIQFSDESWHLEIFKYGPSYEKTFPKITIDKHHLVIKINSFGILQTETDKLFLGYFHYQSSNIIEGLLEINGGIYFFVKLNKIPMILVTDLDENVEINTNLLRKQTKPNKRNGTIVRCMMKVVIGPYLYEAMSKNVTFRTARERLSKITGFVTNVMLNINNWFSNLPDILNIEFFIEQLFILTPNVCEENFTDAIWLIPIKILCDKNSTADAILDEFESFYYDTVFCLTAAFIHHKSKFETLGYANTGSICRRFQNKRVLFVNLIDKRFIFKSLSTALVLGHEIGHALNADHDEKTSCETDGSWYYIMRSKHDKIKPIYSNCSINDMGNYIKIFDRKNCFAETKTKPLCGNGLLEGNEECDCGLQKECYCCDMNVCRLKQSAQCSRFGVHGMCCDEAGCDWKPRALNIKCKPETKCNPEMFCHENVGCKYDSSSIKNDLCEKNTKVCVNGSCEVSICSLWNLTESPSQSFSNETCLIKCFDSHLNLNFFLSELPSHPKLENVDLSLIFYPVGSGCLNKNEYCDQNGNCVPFEGEFVKEISIYLFMNPVFYKKISLLINKYFFLFIISLIVFYLLVFCLFGLSHLKEKVIIYLFLLRNISNEIHTFNKSNIMYFRIFSRKKVIKRRFTAPEMNMIVKDLKMIRLVRISYNYLLRKQRSFVVDGELVEIQNETHLASNETESSV